jgi:hypothetical protein
VEYINKIMFVTLVSAVLAQDWSANLTTECSTAAAAAYPSLLNATSASIGALIGNVNPLVGLLMINSTSANMKLCSAEWASAVTKFGSAVSVACKEQVIFAGTDVPAWKLSARSEVLQAIGCVKVNLYCLSDVIVPAMQAKGYLPGVTSTILPSLTGITLDSSLACANCTTQFLAALKTNIANYPQLEPILVPALVQVNSTCAVKATKSAAQSDRSLLALMAVIAAFSSLAL